MLTDLDPNLINCIFDYLTIEYWELIENEFLKKILFKYPKKCINVKNKYRCFLEQLNIQNCRKVTFDISPKFFAKDNTIIWLFDFLSIFKNLQTLVLNYLDDYGLSYSPLTFILPSNLSTLNKIVCENCHITGIKDFENLHTLEITNYFELGEGCMLHEASYKIIISTKNKIISSKTFFHRDDFIISSASVCDGLKNCNLTEKDKSIITKNITLKINNNCENFQFKRNSIPDKMNNANCFYFCYDFCHELP